MSLHCILLSHGNFAKECLKSAQMVVGETHNVTAIGMQEDQGIESFKEEIATELESHSDQGIIIMVDIFGGTPSNVAIEACANQPNIRVLTGLNLPMVVNFVLDNYERVEDADALMAETQNLIQMFSYKNFQ